MIAMSSRIDPLSIYYAPLKSKITFLALVSTINTATPASFWLVYRIYRTFPSCMTWTHWTKFFTISLPLSPWQPPDGEIWTLVHHLWEFKMQPLCKTIRRFFKKKIQNRMWNIRSLSTWKDKFLQNFHGKVELYSLFVYLI